jgi:hypothetical protein
MVSMPIAQKYKATQIIHIKTKKIVTTNSHRYDIPLFHLIHHPIILHVMKKHLIYTHGTLIKGLLTLTLIVHSDQYYTNIRPGRTNSVEQTPF